MRKILFSLLALIWLLAACAPQKPPRRPAPPPNRATPRAASPTATSPSAVAATPTAATAADDCGATEQNSTDENPLASHEVYFTTTPDGMTFPDPAGQRILKAASVPDLTIGPDGHLWVYFVNGQPGKHGIYAARQTNDGNWEVLGCIKLDGKFNGNAVDPNVLRLPDGRIRLVYFQGNFVSQTLEPGEPNPIFSAVSEDGLNFTVEGKLIAIDGATDPTLVQLPDGSWLLAVTAHGQAVLARSDDGTHFTETGQVIPETGIPALALLPNGQVGLYLSRLYLSDDNGQTWHVAENVRVPGNGNDPSLVALPSGGYAFAFKQINQSETEKPPSGNAEGEKPQFNPFEHLTAEQQACLKEAWGETAFQEITTFQRPPSEDEVPAMDACGIKPPSPGEGQPGNPGGGEGNMPGGNGPGGPGGGMVQGNPQPVTLNLQISGRYLMAFHACDTSTSDCDTPSNHQVYLAQSDDGEHWQIVPGWQPFQGSVPDVIRRGNTLYFFSPGTVTRYHLDTGVLDATEKAEIEGVPNGFVDPSLLLDDQGRLVLFFVYGIRGGDPATCGDNDTNGCRHQIGSATEVPGSDGTRFTLDEGARAEVALTSTGGFRTASDPDVFFDGKQYVLYISHGLSFSVWTSPTMQGSYIRIDTLPNGLLSNGKGGVPASYYDAASGMYWSYAHYSPNLQTPAVIRLARHTGFDRQLTHSDFITVISGESIGLGSTWLVASPSFEAMQP